MTISHSALSVLQLTQPEQRLLQRRHPRISLPLQPTNLLQQLLQGREQKQLRPRSRCVRQPRLREELPKRGKLSKNQQGSICLRATARPHRLQLQQRHVVPFETRKADKNGQGEVTIRDLIRSALRLRPDRIVIGEIRGGEALALLQALNTGHAGSMSTIHANTPLDCLRRIETCALLSGIDIPLSALRAQVASAIDAVVHTARLSDGSRKVVSIAEVLPLENNEYRVRELQRWVTESIAPDGKVSGRFEEVAEPSFADQAKIVGVEL